MLAVRRHAPRLTRAALGAALTLAALPASARAQAPDSLAYGARVDSLFQRFARVDGPGCVVAVSRDGRVVLSRGYGAADLAAGTALGPGSVFYVASLTKQFTAAAVLLLAREGKLSLDDDVRRHVPELPRYGRAITIRHLLHHTGGVRDYLALLALAGRPLDAPYSEKDVLSLITRQQSLNFSPGERHLYTNSGYFLLSLVVRRASGQSLRAFAESRLFAPLGMTHTRFQDDHREAAPGRAVGYTPKGAQLEDGWKPDVPALDAVGDGGVLSTAEDLLRWDANFERHAVGGADFVQELTRPGRLADGRAHGYAYGLVVGQWRGVRRVGHGGAYGGYRSEYARFPDQRLAVVTLCNSAAANAALLTQQVSEVFLGDAAPAPARREVLAAGATAAAPRAAETVPVAAESGAPVGLAGVRSVSLDSLAEHVGFYRDLRNGAVRRVEMRDGRLFYARGAGVELVPIAPSEFAAVGTATRVAFVPSGRTRRMILVTADAVDVYERMPGPITPANQLREFTGVYDSNDARAAIRIELKGGRLVVDLGGTVFPLAPGPNEMFMAGDVALLRFEREWGRVDRLMLDMERLNGVRFVKR